MTDAARASKAPRTWYFLGTLGFTLLATSASVLGALLTFAILTRLQHVRASSELFDQTYWQTVIQLGAFPCELGVIWLAVRLARRQFSEYLALRWPTRDEVILALLVMFIIDYTISSLAQSIGVTADAGVIAEFRRAQRDGPLLFFLFLVIGCIGAPLVEEFAVRGFMMRGWSASFLRPAGAIVLSSAFWALCHTQYEWFGVFEIFLVGLVLGFFRHRSGSTWLTVIVHSADNMLIYFLLGLTT